MSVTGFSSSLLELATVYYACRDTETLLKTFAARVGTSLNARGVLVWLSDDGSATADQNSDAEAETELRLRLRAAWFPAGERTSPTADLIAEGLPLQAVENGETLRLSLDSDDSENLSHLSLHSSAKIKTVLYCVLPGTTGTLGVVEILDPRGGTSTHEEERYLEEASRITALVLENRLQQEDELQDHLATVERLTLLYDIGRTFTSTLELEELLPVIAEKLRDIMQAEACNLWLADAEAGDLYAVQQAGEDPTLSEDARCAMGEGAVGKVAQTGQGLLVENAAEETQLDARRASETADFHIDSMMCVPLLKEAEVIGAVEMINKIDGGAFAEKDLFFLSSICEQATIAIHNANLLKAERKLNVLDALLNISREITSTLDLDHVLTTVVHQASTVVPFDRCAIGLFDRDRFLLGAVSGENDVPKTPEMGQLRDIMEWVAGREEPVSNHQYEDGWHASPEETKPRTAAFLEAQDYSGFYALSLRDDQGAIGAIALMHGDAEFLNESERETVSILANQTAVAIRNAQLYQQVPLAGFLKPLAERRQKFLAAMPRARWMKWAWRATAAAALLIAIPIPMRIGANATVVPAERRVVSAEAGGIAERVLIHEGSVVHSGDLLAVLDSSAAQLELAQARSSLAIAQRALADAEFQRDPAAAGQAGIQVQLYRAQVQLEQKRVDEAQLIAPISGVVVTPRVEQKVGTMLSPGEAFCELVDEAHMAVTMNVREVDLPMLRAGSPVRIKLNSLPTDTLHGTLDRIGAMTQPEEGEQFFVVRADFANSGLAARDGMVGRGKILAGGGWFSSGWYPVGYVIFRAPFRWAWEKAWSWLP
ncbi:MAG TPA: GAF domain-containing protein [Candidatus Acidoferrales bacterium]|nr:GAF domain-containing protein [Candidatus Acidoferrales bacterium]